MSGSVGGYYCPKHRSQYEAGASPVTRRAGCTWTSAANGADAATSGRVNRTPDQVHALVKSSEETAATTPGWSLHDAKLALSRLGISSEIRTGQGWAAVEAAHRAGFYILVQGDSDQFGNGTCSGTFDGDHCVGVHPGTRTNPEGTLEWYLDDPICPTGRWETPGTLRRYAAKFNAGISFLVVLPAVAKSNAPTRFRVVISGPTRIYNRVGGTPIGGISKATYVCTRTKRDGLWWYRIVGDGRAFRPGRYTKASVIG